MAASVPSELLRRRPDVIAAERRRRRQCTDRVTVAAYYPSITLSGSFGQRGANLSDLLSCPTASGRWGRRWRFSLFDGGARARGKAQDGGGV